MPVWGLLCPLKDTLPSGELKKDEYTVGREAKCNLVINETHLSKIDFNLVSKKHFKISRKKDGVCLEGYATTYVNNKKIGPKEKTDLKHNDRIAIGKLYLKVFVYLDKKECDTASQNLPDKISVKYLKACFLGEGGFGEVSLIFTKDKGKMFALKTVKKDQKLIRYAYTEKNILERVKHPCVIYTEEVVDTPSHLFIVLEFMEGGDLLGRVYPGRSLQESHIKLIFFQLAQAIQYLHQEKIVHRDIKPENILLASNESETLIKVTDFGVSKILKPGTQMDTRVGTVNYRAPEVLDAPKCAYNKEVDIWSMGILLYFCLSSEFPFEESNSDVREVRFSQSCWTSKSIAVTGLIKGMLKHIPEKRTDLNMILSHSWLQDDIMRRKAHNLMWPEKPYVPDRPPPAHFQRAGSLRQIPRGVAQYMSSNQYSSMRLPNRPRQGMDSGGQLQMQPAAKVPSPNRPQPGMGASGHLLIQPAAKVPSPNRPQLGVGASGQLLIQPAGKVPSPNRPQLGMGASGQLLIQPAAKVPSPNRPQPGMGASGQLLIQPAAKVPSPNRPQPGIGASRQLQMQPATQVPAPNAVRVPAPGRLQDAARELNKPSVEPAAQNAMQARQPYAAGMQHEPAKPVKDIIQRFERK